VVIQLILLLITPACSALSTLFDEMACTLVSEDPIDIMKVFRTQAQEARCWTIYLWIPI